MLHLVLVLPGGRGPTVVDVLDDSEAVVHVNEVLTMHMGPEFVLLNVSAAFRPESSAGELEAAVAALDARICQRVRCTKDQPVLPLLIRNPVQLARLGGQLG